MKKTPLAALSLALVLAAAALAPALAAQGVTPQVSVLRGEANFLTDYEPINLDGTVNAVIEIPAGTTAKYETTKDTGMLELEQKNGKPRFVQYLGYPCNYGLIPRSMLPKSKGGDGDPLDVCVLGPTVPIGSVVKARPIGILTLLDSGEVDCGVVSSLEPTVVTSGLLPLEDDRSAAPIDSIVPVMQGQTPLFIPLLHVTLEGEGQSALTRSFVIGTPGTGAEGRVQPLLLTTPPGGLPPLKARAIDPPPAA